MTGQSWVPYGKGKLKQQKKNILYKNYLLPYFKATIFKLPQSNLYTMTKNAISDFNKTLSNDAFFNFFSISFYFLRL